MNSPSNLKVAQTEIRGDVSSAEYHLYLGNPIHLIFLFPGNYFCKEVESILLSYETGAAI